MDFKSCSSKERLPLPSVEVPSDLEDEFTPEVDEDGNIWWYVKKLVAKERRYSKEKKKVWHYLTRFVGHGADDDRWLTPRQLSCENLIREIHGKPPIAMPAGSGRAIDTNGPPGSLPDLGWSKFFGFQGGRFMKVLDEVLGEFVSEGLYTWSGNFVA
jgi:hypothetical protein